MPDTVRTQTDLLTNVFQDGQAPGSITASDIRDLIVSLSPTLGIGHFETPAVFDVQTIGAWANAVSGTSSLHASTSDVDMPQHGRIRYIGTTTRHFAITVTLTATVDGNNQDCRFRLLKNGVEMTESVAGRTWGTGTDEGSLTIMTGTSLSPNDYIELQVVNDTSTGDITVVNGVIIMHGHI